MERPLVSDKEKKVLQRQHQEIVPSQLFMSCTDLLHLDLSNNSLEQLPPQLRRLTNLQTLALNNNPLSHFQVGPPERCIYTSDFELRFCTFFCLSLPRNL
jgi:Leucine rich repeat